MALLSFAAGYPVEVRVGSPQKAGTVAVADAILFTRVAATCGSAVPTLQQYQELQRHPQSVTLDDASASKTGLPSLGKCEATAYLGTAHVVHDGSASAVFDFVPPSSGCYRVEEFHPNASAECPLEASTSVRVDYCAGKFWAGERALAQGGGQWNAVGHWPFHAGNPGKLTTTRLGGYNGRHWVADAVRFVKVAEECNKVPYSALVTLRMTGADLPAPLLSGGSASHAKLRLALHALVADAVGLGKEAVRLLGVHNGSIVAELEFAGAENEVAVAVAKLRKALGSGLAGSLCAAAEAPGCSVELVRTTAAPPRPSRSGDGSSPSSWSTGLALVHLSIALAVALLSSLLVAAGS